MSNLNKPDFGCSVTTMNGSLIKVKDYVCDKVNITVSYSYSVLENKTSDIIVQDEFNSPVFNLVQDDSGLISVLSLTGSIDAYETIASEDDGDNDENDDAVYIISTNNLLNDNIVLLEAGDSNNYIIDAKDYFYGLDFKDILASHQTFSNSISFGSNILSWDRDNIRLKVEGFAQTKKDIATLEIVSTGETDSKNAALKNVDLSKTVTNGVNLDLNFGNLNQDVSLVAGNGFNSVILTKGYKKSLIDGYDFEYQSITIKNVFNGDDNMSQFGFDIKITDLISLLTGDFDNRETDIQIDNPSNSQIRAHNVNQPRDKEYRGASVKIDYGMKSELTDDLTFGLGTSMQVNQLLGKGIDHYVDNQYGNAAVTFKLEASNGISTHVTFGTGLGVGDVELKEYFRLNDNGDLVSFNNKEFDNPYDFYSINEFGLSYSVKNKSGLSGSVGIDIGNNEWDKYKTIKGVITNGKFYLDARLSNKVFAFKKQGEENNLGLGVGYFGKNTKLDFYVQQDEGGFREDLLMVLNLDVHF